MRCIQHIRDSNAQLALQHEEPCTVTQGGYPRLNGSAHRYGFGTVDQVGAISEAGGVVGVEGTDRHKGEKGAPRPRDLASG